LYYTYVIRTNIMHTFYINILIIVFSTCFEHPSVHPQEDLKKVKKKIKQSLYRPGVAQRVPGS